MSAPFAALQARTTSAVMRRLANADALIGAQPVQGIFARRPAEIGGVSTTLPTFTLPSSDVAAYQVKAGTVIAFPASAESFAVLDVQPDGAGLTLLVLEVA